MDCFIDYIGVKGCDSTEPESGVYINDLPGVTLENIERIANAEQITFAGVWDEVQKRSIRQFVRKAETQFRIRYQALCCKDDCSFEDLLCSIKEELTDALLYFLGANLMTERLYSSRMNRFTTIDREQAEELRDYFMVEFEKNLEAVINTIPSDKLNDCFECVNTIQRKEVLP